MASSRTVAGFWLPHAVRRPGGLSSAMDELFSLVRAGRLRRRPRRQLPAAPTRGARTRRSHRRRTTGKLVLEVVPAASAQG